MSLIQCCNRCSYFPDDILMLQCNHDLCLKCASQTFLSQNFKNNKVKRTNLEKQILYCDICSIPTELDISSVFELEKLSTQSSIITQSKIVLKLIVYLLSQNKKVITPNELLNNSSNNRQLTQTGKYALESLMKSKNQDKENFRCPISSKIVNMNKKTGAKNLKTDIRKHSRNSSGQVKNFCREHRDEELNYFCFDCLSNCICSECVIHGVHNSHEVQTIRKAFPTVKKALIEIQEKNNLTETFITEQRELIEAREQQQKQKVNSLRLQIHQEFQNLYQMLNQKEQEAYECLNQIPELKTQYNSFLVGTSQIEIEIKQINRQISEVIEQNNEINVLELFANFSKNQPQSPLPLGEISEVDINSGGLFGGIREIKQILGHIGLQLQKEGDIDIMEIQLFKKNREN